MKSRDTLIRLKRFQVEEKRRRVIQIETMIAEFTRMATELDREITLEEQRAGITDMSHFAYPTYARAARGRRDNLQQSCDDLKQQLDDAKAGFAEAQEEYAKAQSLEGREKTGERVPDLSREAAGERSRAARI
jgi:flagellar export protein FliJ